uniref:Uncharacterized protein n=1 Tax=Pundamilia nyererei TaxID=303518 RepID=A0A3B4FPT3_9CICH
MKIAAFNGKNLGHKKVHDKSVIKHLTKVIIILPLQQKCSTPPSHLNIKNCISVVDDLVLIPVHTKPEDSLKELDELHDVVEDIRKKWKNDNIMLLGDFNADGRYLSKKKKEKIRICSSSYNWLIDDNVDTTASNKNDNTYDRIVVYGQTMLNAIVPNSAKSFNFQQEFDLTDEEALGISDHYPVEVELKTKDASGEGQSKKKVVSSLINPFPNEDAHTVLVFGF